ncbi:ABC transporter permease [Spirosoma foliorum]|uniref:FtsX-like permease family protein n=1 Tax=Spirosoma foliorum TaxID=2710596 RepID=A0A7G5GWF0_9BACT|nr:ABC transporter permease [Spirosoma foliorum]QMW03192.1 FtsX-like permease family protein [Spirosoma foliorum]
MFSNYIKIAWRNIRSGGGYSVLNIGGLAVVLAVSVLLLWWVKDELSFDRFHADSNRIYRVNAHFGKGDDERFWSGTPAPIAVAAANKVPGVEQVVRVGTVYDFRTFRVNDGKGPKTFTEQYDDLAFVDENFLNLFTGFAVRNGNPTNPFPSPNSVVMTEEMANKFFGTSEAVGKTLTVLDSNRVFTVSAILANMPDNSSLQYKVFFPMSLRKRTFGGNGDWKRLDDDWGNYYFRTFLKLSPTLDPAAIGKKLTELQAIARNTKPGDPSSDYQLQALTQSHLYEADGKDTGMQQVRMLGLIALLLLSIGCINYINLTTARATRRAREVGVRKVIGAESRQLLIQLMVESLLTMGIALLVAVVLIQLLMPYYHDLTNKKLGFSLLNPEVWALLIGALVLTIGLAGLYPAIMMSSLNPIRSLRGRGAQSGQAGLRKVLVVTQFALATGLIIGTLVIGEQLRYIRERDLGFDKEHTFVFYAGEKAQQYKRELEKESSIRAVVTATGGLVGGGGSTGDTDWDGKAPERSFIVDQLGISHDFIPAYGMKMSLGKNFTGTKADSTSFILNETAIKQSGITNPIGKRFKFHQTEGHIIGVVKDISTASIRSEIQPMVLYSIPGDNGIMHVKTTGQQASQAIAAAERLWKRDKPEQAFEYTFLDETYNRMYRTEQRTGQLFSLFAGVAILVCCLGLFGLAAFTAEQRTKEIGVRKVLGASVTGIVSLLSKDFLKLVLIGILVATPVAWYIMSQWLQDFAYKIDMQWWMFVLAGLLAVGIALLTVSYQSVKAALMNPVKSLKTE